MSYQLPKRKRRQRHIGLSIVPVEFLVNNIVTLSSKRKRTRAQWFKEAFPEFLRKEKKNYEDYEYFHYLKANRTNVSEGNARRGTKREMRKEWDLLEDIRENGLVHPLDIVIMDDGDRHVLMRGARRAFILHHLGVKDVPCRIFRSIESYKKLAPPTSIVPNGPIEAAAMDQFKKHRSKATDKYWVHNYTELYDKYISHLDKPRILEIGVLRWASLFIWKEAFPGAKVFGVDIDPRPPIPGYDKENVTVFVGNQNDEEFMRGTVAPHGPFDVVIDDASHKPIKTFNSMTYLWSSVAPGGWYIVEDLHHNYRRGRVGRTMQGLKTKVDEIYTADDVAEVHFHFNICFVRKK